METCGVESGVWEWSVVEWSVIEWRIVVEWLDGVCGGVSERNYECRRVECRRVERVGERERERVRE